MSKATLLVIQGIDVGARFEIGEAPVGIGRGVQNEFRILDTEASRTHARIAWDERTYRLTDLASANGTYVNGRAVRMHELANGDQIQIGRSILVFSVNSKVADGSHAAEKVQLQLPSDDRSSIVGEMVSSDSEPFGNRTSSATSAQTSANLQVLYRISEEAVRPSISLEQMLQRILDMTLEAVGADRGCVLIRDPESGDLRPEVFSPMRGRDDSRMPVSRSIVDYVLQSRQGVRTTDAQADSRFIPGQSILQAGIREAICVPMQGRYELMGVIYVDITTPPERIILSGSAASHFSEDLLRLMVAIGRQSALAIEDNRYQQALVKAERLGAVGQTITTLSHHIKNILQGVRGGSYLIDMGLKDHNEDVVRKGWRIVEKNQNKIYNLVMDMLTFSKERQPSYQLADINETVGDVCELMQARADECQIGFEFEPTPTIPATMFDPEGIHRSVLNILTNAFDAVEGQADPRVSVTTSFDSDERLIVITVRDNGAGIPKDQVDKIFNIFESTKGARGTGLGLAVSQKIIREHGGDIMVESHVGKGSCFALSLPWVDEQQSPSDSQTLH